jgi:hypothetical protein
VSCPVVLKSRSMNAKNAKTVNSVVSCPDWPALKYLGIE